MMRHLAGLFASAIVALASPPAAIACLHFQVDQAKKISHEQDSQDAIILHRDGVEDLVMRVKFHATPVPDSVAWVIPVPDVPRDYGAEDDELFEAVKEWVNLTREEAKTIGRWDGKTKGSKRSTTRGGVTVVQSVTVGPYDINVVEATGKSAATQLNEWLKQNGFETMPTDHLTYYIERDWAFVAVKAETPTRVKMAKQKTEDDAGEDGDEWLSLADPSAARSTPGLPPLRMSFASEDVVYPLKLSTRQGTFPVNVFVFTPQRIAPEQVAAITKKGFEVVGSAEDGRYYEKAPGAPPEKLKADNLKVVEDGTIPLALAQLLKDTKLAGRTLYVTVLHADDFDASTAASWKQDLTIDL